MIDNAKFKRSGKTSFSEVSIYGYCFLGEFLRLLINCYNIKRSNFSFITAYFFTSTVLTFFTSTYCADSGCENPFIYFNNYFSFVYSEPIISEYVNKFSRKGIPSTRFANYLAWVWPQQQSVYIFGWIVTSTLENWKKRKLC